eukprot:666008-Pelagomonas_calceolata.AAC.2
MQGTNKGAGANVSLLTPGQESIANAILSNRKGGRPGNIALFSASISQIKRAEATHPTTAGIKPIGDISSALIQLVWYACNWMQDKARTAQNCGCDASTYVEGDKGQDRGQVQRASQRGDDPAEEVEVGVCHSPAELQKKKKIHARTLQLLLKDINDSVSECRLHFPCQELKLNPRAQLIISGCLC